MAAIYNYCDNTKVVLSLRGGEAVQHVSDASIRQYGLRLLQRIEEDAAKLGSLEGRSVEQEQATPSCSTPVGSSGVDPASNDDSDIEIK